MNIFVTVIRNGLWTNNVIVQILAQNWETHTIYTVCPFERQLQTIYFLSLEDLLGTKYWTCEQMDGTTNITIFGPCH